MIQSKNPGVVRMLAITDPHLTDINPPAYRIDYMNMVEEAIDSVIRFAEKVEADAFVWGGDIYHRKSARQNSHALNARIFRINKRIQETMVNAGILGNHDYPFGDKMKGVPGQACEALLESGTFHLLDDDVPPNDKGEPMKIPHGSLLFDAGDFKVRLGGYSYKHARAEPVRDIKKDGADWLLSIGHFWFGTQTGEFFGEPVFGPDFLEQGEVDAYFIGHHHADQGVQIVNGRTYVSAGSITRTGGHKGDRQRKPAAVFFEFTKEGIKAQVLRPKMPTAEEAMDLEQLDKMKAESKEMDQLTAALDAAETTSKDPNEILEEIEMSVEVRTKAKDYLQEAEHA